MIYVVGFIGFTSGFLVGQMMLYFMLRHVPRENLLKDKYLKWKYGLLNWAIAGLGAYLIVEMYVRYYS